MVVCLVVHRVCNPITAGLSQLSVISATTLAMLFTLHCQYLLILQG